MWFAAVTQTVKVVDVDLSAYPRWLVVAVGTLVLAFVLWVMMKLLKWTLWLVVFAVLVGGFTWAAWLGLQALGWVK